MEDKKGKLNHYRLQVSKENERINEFLSNQQNVSSAVVLVLTDYINKYGTGDVLINVDKIMNVNGQVAEKVEVEMKPVVSKANIPRKSVSSNMNKKTDEEVLSDKIVAKTSTTEELMDMLGMD